MINVIFNGFYDDVLRKVIDNVCRNISIGFACVVYYEKTIENLPVKESQFVKYHSLLLFEKSLGDPNELIPLDAELIANMANCERMVLKMIDRLEVRRRYTYRERIELYYFFLRYWNTVIETHRVNLFVSANVPHEIFDYVIYELCKLKKIPIIFFYHQSQIKDAALIMYDWKENSLKLQSRFQELQKLFQGKSEAEIDLSEKLQRHFNAQVTNSTDAVPFYMQSQRKPNLRTRYKFIFDLVENAFSLFSKNPVTFLLKCINPVKWGRVAKYLWERLKIVENATNKYYDFYYKQHSVYPNLKKTYIYVPLQYQPELSTSPLAGAFADQQLLIQMISKYLPGNVYLYVKEHPKQTSFCRNIEFYQGLRQIKNVVLVRKDCDSTDLIYHCVAVATCTGTPGWEALFREKPVLMFGSYIYQFADGVYKITTNLDCQQALDQILHHHARPSLKNIKLYLKALGDVSIPAVIDPDYLRVSKLTEKENIDNITQTLLAEMNQISPSPSCQEG